MPGLIMPTTPNFSSSNFGLRSNTQSFESPLSGAVQTFENPGAKWMGSFGLPPMLRSTASAWQAFLTRLRGMNGRFWGSDPDALSSQIATAVNTTISSQTDKSTLVLVSATDYSVGDYIEVVTSTGTTTTRTDAAYTSEYKLITTVVANTVTIEPPMRDDAVAADVVIIDAPFALMRLMSDESASWDANQNGIYKIAFDAIEVVIP